MRGLRSRPGAGGEVRACESWFRLCGVNSPRSEGAAASSTFTAAALAATSAFLAWLCPRDHELVRFKLFNDTAGAAFEPSRFRARAKLPGSLRTAGDTVRFTELFCPGSLGAGFAPCPRPRRLKERVRRVDSFLRGVEVVLGTGGTSAFLRGAEAGLSAEAGGGTAATGGLAGFFRPKDSFLTRRLPAAFAAFSICAQASAPPPLRTYRREIKLRVLVCTRGVKTQGHHLPGSHHRVHQSSRAVTAVQTWARQSTAAKTWLRH